MWFETMAPHGHKLVVENTYSPNTLAVVALEWTISPLRLPLANLNWGDPVLETLPWEAVISDTLWLAPGGRQEFPVPSHLDQPDVYGLVRAISGNMAPYDLAEDVMQGYTYAASAAEASTWGRIKALMR
jgi:hypothetical protein